MKIADVPESQCPVCGYMMDCSTCLSDDDRKTPKAGDISLCLKCGEVLVFASDLTVRQANLVDMLDLQKHPDSNALLLKAQSLIRSERFIK